MRHEKYLIRICFILLYLGSFQLSALFAADLDFSTVKAKIDGVPVDVHLVRAKDSKPSEWKTLPVSGGYLAPGQSLPELASQYGAATAINANFFREDHPGEQEPIGLVVHDGQVLSFPSHYYPSAAFIKDKLDWDIVSFHASIELDLGKKKLKEKLCRVNGRASRGCASVWLNKIPSKLSNSFFIQNEKQWGLPLTKKTYLASETSDADVWAVQWPSSIDSSSVKSVTIEVHLKGDRLGNAWQTVKEAVSGSHILTPKKVHPPLTRSWVIARQPRSMMGVDGEGKPFIVVFDGRRNDSRGTSVQEAWKYLRKNHNVAWALNLDGGGSATLINEGSLANKPSDHIARSIAVGWGVVNESAAKPVESAD